MRQFMKKIWHKVIPVLFTLLLLGAVAFYVGLRVNVTNSLPLGLYVLTTALPERGDLVAFDLPEHNPYASIASSRNYGGLNMRPYLKHLAAVPGDDIQMDEQSLRINGQLMPNSAFRDSDRMGRPLSRFLVTGTVPTGKALVLSGYHPMSFDGRYFGLLDLTDLQKVIPILTFN